LQVVNFVCWYGVWQNAKTNGILFFMVGMVWSRTSDTYSLYFYMMWTNWWFTSLSLFEQQVYFQLMYNLHLICRFICLI
jgi:hypothetical protein